MASEFFRELEEVPLMTMVGGFDVHRKQITFDYVDTDTGLVRCGEIRPATRKTLRTWLGEHCPQGDAEMAVEGCTGWRYVVEELAVAGGMAHLADPAETAVRRPKKRAKTDRADARLLRTLLLEGRLPESWIPPPHVLEVRTLGRLYCALSEERRAWRQRIHAQLFHQGCPPITALLTEAGREALARAELSATGRQYVDTALRRIDELTADIDPVRTQLVNFARRQARVSGAAGLPVRGWLVVRGDHVGRDRRCPPVSQLRRLGAFRRHGRHRVLLGSQTLTGASVPAGLSRAAVGGV